MIHHREITILLSLTTFIFFSSFSQDIRFDHLSVKQGLSQGNVTDIHQDKLGFIWVSTEDGLNLFNGYSFTVFRNNPEDSSSISNNNVNSIAEDKHGMWIATQAGLNLYNRQTNKFQWFMNDPTNNNTLSNNSINCLFFDSKENLWIGTTKGLNRYNAVTKTFEKYLHDPDNPASIAGNDIRSIIEDHAHRLWIGTYAGLSMMRSTNEFTNYFHDPLDTTSLSSDRVTTLYEDKDYNIWVGTFDAGLNLKSAKATNFIRFSGDLNNTTGLAAPYVRCIREEENKLWIATDGGLNSLNSDGKTFTKYISDPENLATLASNIATKILFDRDRRMWIGTRFGGLNIYEKGKYAFRHFKRNNIDPNSLGGNTVDCFAEDEKGNFWIGIDGAGLDYYDRSTGKFSHLQHQDNNPNTLASNKVLALKIDRNGGLWVGMWGAGLNYYDRKTGRFKHYQNDPTKLTSLSDNNIFHIYEDSKGTIWMSTWGGGICKYNPATDDFTRYVPDPNNPNSKNYINELTVVYMIEDHLGKLWLGTRHEGLDMFDPITETFTHYKAGKKEGDISENVIFSLLEDSQNRLWVGTSGGGLNLFDRKTNTFKAFRQHDGLPNDVIMGILEDDDKNLWISTNKGVCKFNPDALTFKNYDESDGLQSEQFNRWAFTRLKSGELLFGGVNGFNLFNPATMQGNLNKPPVYITDFKLFDKSVPIGDNEVLQKNILLTNEITLTYSQNFFSFEFTALNYRQPEKNKYKYIMEGLRDEWVDIGTERKISFTNLSPGEYVFRVIASNNDGVWNMEGASVRITIVPPFWKTAWFIGLLIAASGYSIIATIRYQKKKTTRQKDELNAIIEKRTSEVTKQNEEIVKKNEHEKIQNWIIQGLAHFGEIISKHKGNLDELSNEILKNLATYVNAQQGTLAIAAKEDEEEEYLKIMATYGVTKQRLEISKIEPGEGLIGATFKDKKKKYLTNLPKNYIKIESGLGQVSPTNLILLPLKTDNDIYGVIELAFLEDVPDVVQEFLDKVASVIALNIHTANLNNKTVLFLQQSKEQTEELRSQEEEMRQNMEELEATQEELKRREKESQDKIQELEEELRKRKQEM